MNDLERTRLCELILRLLNDTMSDACLSELDSLLLDNPEAQDLYCDFIAIHAHLRRARPPLIDMERPNPVYERFSWELLEAMSEMERTSPTVPRLKPTSMETEHEFRSRPVPSKGGKVHRFWPSVAVFSAAVLVLLLVSAHLNRLRSLPPSAVAILTDIEDGQWGIVPSPEKGDALSAGPLELKRGLAQITFDRGAEIILEAPAQFDLEGPDQIFLRHGRLAAKVQKEGIGFTVRTPVASMVDYGTEFGIVVDKMGQAETHVFKGLVDVRSGIDPRVFPTSIRLTANQVCDVDVNGELARSPNPAQPDLFQRYIPSPYERAVLNSGPVSYWRFDPNDPRGLIDVLNPEGFPGLQIEADRFDAGPSAGKGKWLAALGFNEKSIPLLIPQAPIPANFPVTTGYSVALWIRPDTVQSQRILSGMAPEKEDRGVRILSMTDDGRFRHTLLKPTGESIGPAFSRTKTRSGQWYHVVIGRAAYTDRKLFVNGKEEGTSPLSEYSYSNQKVVNGIYLGSVNASNDVDKSVEAPFRGAMSDIAIYNRLLTPSEVETLYRSAK